MQSISKNNWRSASKLNPFCKKLTVFVIQFSNGEQGELPVAFFHWQEGTDSTKNESIFSPCSFLTLKRLL